MTLFLRSDEFLFSDVDGEGMCLFRRGEGEGDLEMRLLARSSISLLLLIDDVLLLPVDNIEESDC